MLESLKKGDHVITYDGVHGKISAVENELVILDVANITRNRVLLEKTRRAGYVGGH